MGAVPCQIIINCGIVKGAANGLAYFCEPYRSHDIFNMLGAAAAQLRDQNDEICRFGLGVLLAPVELTEEQEWAIGSTGARAKLLSATIEAFVFADKRSKGIAESLLVEVRQFTIEQREVFEGIVGTGYGGDDS